MFGSFLKMPQILPEPMTSHQFSPSKSGLHMKAEVAIFPTSWVYMGSASRATASITEGLEHITSLTWTEAVIDTLT